MKSIRVFLTLTLLSVAALLDFAAALRGYDRGMVEAEALFNQRMYQHLDLLNYTRPDLLARGDIRSGRLSLPFRSVAGESRLEFQWAAADGSLLARSDGMPDTLVAELEEGFRFVNFGGYRWHALVAASGDGSGWFVLAERDDQRWRMAESIILPAVYPMLLAIPIFGAIIWLLLGVGLKPVATLARDLEQREASDLRALPSAHLPMELQPLAASANALLRRLDASFARERRFSSDAAHELRTPLAALRIQCENLAFALPEHADAVDKFHAGIERLDHLVEQILMLSRVAPEQAMRRFEDIELHAAIARSVAEQGEALQAKAIDIELLGDATTVRGDAYAIDSLIGNLIGNAIKYTASSGRIRVQTVALDHGVALDVIDSGVGIAANLRDRVFDRFYRVDGDRHDSGTSGCGLGLSIVKAVADMHGATIELRDSVFATGLWVRIVLPRTLAA